MKVLVQIEVKAAVSFTVDLSTCIVYGLFCV